jgi:preprotein translocase subunit YajC
MQILTLLAQAAPGAPEQPPVLFQFLPLIIIAVLFYFLLIRPQQKKAKEHQAMLTALSVGDEVVTAGGILGKVAAIGEGVVTLEIAQGVQIKVQKFQVSSLVPKGTLKG